MRSRVADKYIRIECGPTRVLCTPFSADTGTFCEFRGVTIVDCPHGSLFRKRTWLICRGRGTISGWTNADFGFFGSHVQRPPKWFELTGVIRQGSFLYRDLGGTVVGHPRVKSHVQEINFIYQMQIFYNIHVAGVCRSIVDLSEYRDPLSSKPRWNKQLSSL